MSGGFAVPELSMDLDSIIAKSKTRKSGNRFRNGRTSAGAGSFSTRAAGTNSHRSRANFSQRSQAKSSSANVKAVFSSAATPRKHTGVSKASAVSQRLTSGLVTGASLQQTPFAATSTKVVISNLDFGVTEEDIRQLFSRCGRLKQTQLNYDCNGKSTGTAVITYVQPDAAIRCINQFNNLTLDQRPLRLELGVLPANFNTQPVSARLGRNRALPPKPFEPLVAESSPRKQIVRKAGLRNTIRGPSTGRPLQRRQGNRTAGPKTLSDLDNDLDSYMSKHKAKSGGNDAMQTD